jgi:hypothetical protein
VIDAMLFVFGKKAKQLRLNKVSELIHKSENNMNLTSCKVSVHFVEILDKVRVPSNHPCQNPWRGFCRLAHGLSKSFFLWFRAHPGQHRRT